ncbi:MAG TPA: hypothetical protein DGG94_19715 [Micromonosporaceae bacterium]|nr:hypothetical protein [Micromonosporaceae bacterium]HCU51995.1 hypothetical protein [Micromonosporaceae bacterium]
MIETVQEFIRLVNSADSADRKRAAWEEAQSSVWLTLIENHPEMRFWVAHNRTVPDDVLRKLASDLDWRVRDRIATKNACPSQILELLSHDENEAVASTVAGHPNTPTSALQGLERHPSGNVREKASRQLSKRGEPSVMSDNPASGGEHVQ